MNNLDLTPLFQAVISLVAVLVTMFVIPYIKKKANAAELAEFHGWVKIAVAAAEQLYKVTEGEEKKQYVLDYLHSKGYSVDVDDLILNTLGGLMGYILFCLIPKKWR